MKLSLKSPEPGTSGSYVTPSKPEGFDKYWYYEKSVQSPDVDVQFFQKVYRELKNKEPETLGEDFCGTFAISCEWVKLNENYKAIGVDLDPEPIAYGQKNYLSQLSEAQKDRVEIHHDNVLADNLPKVDMIAACNFSYFIFKQRAQLKAYFQKVYDRVNDGGVFVMDCFGGSQCYEPNEEETEHDTFSYFWDQDSFDPVSNEAMFYIWFQPEGGKKVKGFTYDWRMWSLPELKDILEEVGFQKIHTYWEGTDEDGEGDGEFERVEKGEDCESWVAYLACEK